MTVRKILNNLRINLPRHFFGYITKISKLKTVSFRSEKFRSEFNQYGELEEQTSLNDYIGELYWHDD